MRRAVFLLCCAAAAQTPSPEQRAERWREDIRVLTDRVARDHPDFFNSTGREAFRAATDALLAGVPAKADHEIIVEMARLTALGRDAHTSLSLTQAAANFRLLPLRVYRFSDGWHAVSAFDPRAVGARLLAVGGVPVDEVYERLRPLVSHENESWLSNIAAGLLVSAEVLHAIGVAPELGTASYRLRDAAGQEFTLAARAAAVTMYTPHPAQPVNPWYQRNAGLNYWFAYLADSRTVYVKYNVCRESPMLSIAEFAAKLGEAALQNPVERVVLDVRNNGGGDSRVFQRLGAALAGVPPFLQAVAAGKVFCIVGRGTFSSGMLAALDMRDGGFKLIGEPTGGRPNWYGEVVGFTLPNSRLTVSLSTRLVGLAVGAEDAVAPDVPVEFTAADYFGERDPYLEAALRQ